MIKTNRNVNIASHYLIYVTITKLAFSIEHTGRVTFYVAM